MPGSSPGMTVDERTELIGQWEDGIGSPLAGAHGTPGEHGAAALNRSDTGDGQC